MGLYRSSYVLDKYIGKRGGQVDRPVRDWTPAEFEIYMDLGELWHEFNILICEMLTTTRVLSIMGDKSLEPVTANLFKMTNSLTSQRNKSFAVRLAYATIKPEPNEETEVKAFATMCRTRIRFVESTPLEGNLMLTPIKDYMELTGVKEFRSCLYKFYGNRKAMAAACKKETTGIEDFAKHILETVRKGGRADSYKVRLENYTKMTRDKRGALPEAKKEEERRKRQAELKDGLIIFTNRFYRSVRDLKDDPVIGTTNIAIRHQIEQHGRNGYFIVRCSVYKGEYIYRYIRNNGVPSKSFYGARIYESEDEARKAAEALSAAGGNWAYDFIKLSEVA